MPMPHPHIACMKLPVPFGSLLFAITFVFVSIVFSNSDCFAADFELADGDRVVLLGDALIEQEQYFGWIEIMLSSAFADRDVTFRNLGWSADTPGGDSRCLLYTSPSPRDRTRSRMPSSA